MEIHRTKSLIVILLVLAALVVYLVYAGLLSGRQGTVDSFSVDDSATLERINMVVLQKDTLRVLLGRSSNQKWFLNDNFEADQVMVTELLHFLKHARVNRPVSQSAQDKVNQHLDEQGIQVEFFMRRNFKLIPRKKRIKSFVAASKESPDDEAIYMRLLRSEVPYEVIVPGISVRSDKLFTTNERRWRNPVLFDLRAEQIRKVEISVPAEPGESFMLVNDHDGNIRMFGHDGKAVPPERVNQARLVRYLRSFYTLFYEKLLENDEIAAISEMTGGSPFMSVTVTDTAGNAIFLDCYHLDASHATTLLPVNAPYDPNRFLLRVGEKEFALAQFLVFQRILRPLSFFPAEVRPGEKSQTVN